MNAELGEYGEVPFLRILPGNVIQLSSPRTDLYIGRNTGVLKFFNIYDNIIYAEEFDIVINNEPIDLPDWYVESD